MESAQKARARVVLLGASNLSFGLSTVCGAARARLARPIDVYAAPGPGRSYGQVSRFLGRVLPSIESCGLWSALGRDRNATTYALVTDLGNDIGFGADAQQVERWLTTALDRLAQHDARIVVTGLPLTTLARLPAWEFYVIARVLFPFHRIRRARILDQARELDERLARLAAERGIPKIDPRPDWFGRDPIHVRRRWRREAWSTYASGWPAGSPPSEFASARWSARPRYERVRCWGVERGAPQPCAKFSDGCTLRLY